MVNYQNGKIYKIICNKTGKCYIGSTIESLLSRRLSHHMKDYKKWKSELSKKYYSSFEIFDLCDYHIILIENYSCDNKDQLRARKQYHIDHSDCVNKRNSFLTDEQRSENIKLYQKSDIQINYRKDYYEQNKQILNEKHKEYNLTYKKKPLTEEQKEKKKTYDKQRYLIKKQNQQNDQIIQL